VSSVHEQGVAARAVTAGVDWAEADHAVCVVDAEGAPVERVCVPHTKAGIARLVRVLRRHAVVGVGIERPDGPVVDALFAAGVAVFVIAPSQVKALRARYGSAGNKDDRFDAFVLADTVRTDRRRLTPLERDSLATTGLRQLCRTRKDVLAHQVAVANQLRAHLMIALPAVVGLFSTIDAAISRAFLTAFATQEAVDQLTAAGPDQLAGWLRQARYTGRTDPGVLHTRLTGAPAGATGDHGRTLADITRVYLEVLNTLATQLAALTSRIGEALDQHPDKAIFTSLPRVGTLRAARLIGEIGDARGRFPTPAALACLAGVAPATRQSGKTRIVTFRWAVDKQLRDAVCDFAGDSHHANDWAAQRYAQARARGCDHPHAVRILGRAWLHIIWKCWTTRTPYDPARHGALQRLQQQDQKQGG
jgi:transposase